jgi:hypothetical protein
VRIAGYKAWNVTLLAVLHVALIVAVFTLDKWVPYSQAHPAPFWALASGYCGLCVFGMLRAG